MSRAKPFLAVLTGLLAASPALATDVDVEGFYRTRVRLYDTLSLASPANLETSEGTALYAQHRLWLRGRVIPSSKVGLFLELKGLDGVVWGSNPLQWVDPTSEAVTPLEWTDDLTPPLTSDDGTHPLLDLTLWRAWGEVDTKIGRFSFGRMPLDWASGVWQNDGLPDEDDPSAWADFGDTADRVQWEKKFDQVYVRAAVDVNAEGLVAGDDDTTSFNLVGAYRSEIVEAGVNGQYRRTPSRSFDLFTVSAAARATLGNLEAKTEWVGQFGSGDLANGQNDQNILAVGGVLDVSLRTPSLAVGLLGGLATGDKDDTDSTQKTFTFDRDFNVGLVMFEQPLPVLVSADSDGRSTSQVQSGIAVRNALFLQPRAEYQLVDGLSAEAKVLWARTAALPERLGDRGSYGWEIDAGLRWTGTEHLDLVGTGGVFLPGNYFSNYTPDGTTVFKRPVAAAQLTARVRF